MLAVQTVGMVFAVVMQMVCFVATLGVPIMMIAHLADIRNDIKSGFRPSNRILSLRWLLCVIIFPVTMYLLMFAANATTLVEQPSADVLFYASFALVVGVLLSAVYLAYREYVIRSVDSPFSATLRLKRILWRGKWLHPLVFRKKQQLLREQAINSKHPVSLHKQSSDA